MSAAFKNGMMLGFGAAFEPVFRHRPHRFVVRLGDVNDAWSDVAAILNDATMTVGEEVHVGRRVQAQQRHTSASSRRRETIPAT